MRKQMAFSLVELMLAMAIFAAAFMVLLGTLPLASSTLHQSQDRLRYTYVAEQALEQARTQPYSAIVSNTTDNGDCAVQVVVTEPQPGALKTLRVVVSWSATGAVSDRSRHLELITYVAKTS